MKTSDAGKTKFFIPIPPGGCFVARVFLLVYLFSDYTGLILQNLSLPNCAQLIMFLFSFSFISIFIFNPGLLEFVPVGIA